MHPSADQLTTGDLLRLGRRWLSTLGTATTEVRGHQQMDVCLWGGSHADAPEVFHGVSTGVAVRVFSRRQMTSGRVQAAWSDDVGPALAAELARNGVTRRLHHLVALPGALTATATVPSPLARLPDDPVAVLVAVDRALRRIGTGLSWRLRLRQADRLVVNTEGRAATHREGWLSADLRAELDGRYAARAAAFSVSAEPAEIADMGAALLREVTAHRAAAPPAGRYEVVCDAEFAGLLAHEVVGHALEADSYEHAQRLPLGARVAADIVTVTDDPCLPVLGGGYPFDDEGVTPRRTSLVADGRVVGLIHSLETAAKWDSEPTGHGRAVDWRHDPIPRLSVTGFEPVPDAPTDLAAEVRSGLLVRGARGGYGGVPVALVARQAYLVHDGRIGAPIGSVLIRESPAHLLASITAVGSVSRWHSGGEGGCGKLDQFPLPVAAGGAQLRLSECPVVTW